MPSDSSSVPRATPRPPQPPLAWRLRLGALIERWQARPPDTARPIVLDARRIYILPSGGGLLFAVALVVMLLGAINYDLGLGHALVFLLAALGLVGMVHTWRNLLRLRLTPGRPEPVFAGETAHLPCLIDNPDDTPRCALELSVAGQTPCTVVDVDTRASIRAFIPCPAPQRGRQRIARLVVATRYPLGLFTAWSTPRPVIELLVYPRPEFHPLPRPAVSQRLGWQQGDAGEEDFAGLRPHRPNDAPRHIAWKVAARDGAQRPLQVKQFAGGTAGELTLDWAATAGAVPADDRERRLSVLAGWVLTADRQQLTYTLHLPGRHIAGGHGPTQRAACLEALADYGRDDSHAAGVEAQAR